MKNEHQITAILKFLDQNYISKTEIALDLFGSADTGKLHFLTTHPELFNDTQIKIVLGIMANLRDFLNDPLNIKKAK